MEAEEETPVLEQEDLRDPAEEAKQRRRSSKKRKSSRRKLSTSTTDAQDVRMDTRTAGRHLRVALAFGLLGILLLDFLALGLRGDSTPFVDWWDMIGTVAYLRGRHQQFSLRSKGNQGRPLWMLYIVLDAYILYEIAGKTSRTIMRKRPVLPTMLGFSDFVVYGLLPVHFFPGDYLYEMTDKDDIHVLIMSAFWGLTKVRSLYSQIHEAVFVHKYGFPAAFFLCLLSCEIASVYSRVEMNLTRFTPKECMHRLPGGLKSWLLSRTFASSLVISSLMFVTVRATTIPVVWVFPNLLAYFACFYRYANGLLERVVSSHVKIDKTRIQDLDPKAVQNLIDNFDPDSLQKSLKDVPDRMVQESIKLTQSLIVSLEQLGQDSKVDLEELMSRLEEISEKLHAQVEREDGELRRSSKLKAD